MEHDKGSDAPPEQSPQKPPESREPTLDELLAIMHADELSFWKSGSGSPQQREEFLEGVKARWRTAQTPPVAPPSRPEPPEVKPDDDTVVNQVPRPNPTEDDFRWERINRALREGRRPDPEDLAKEQEYQERLADAIERQLKLPAKKPQVSPARPKKKPAHTGWNRGRKKKSAPPPPSLGENMWRLTESNFFWGGGVGMVTVAYGFLLAGALKFSITLLVIGWLVITVSIYRHNFFEGKRRRTQLIGQTLTPAVLAILFAMLWVALRPDPSRPDVALRFVYAKSPALVVANQSDAVAREARWTVLLWNIDLPDRVDALPIPTSNPGSIRPREELGPENLFHRPAIAPLLKPGNRLAGSAVVTCPECVRNRTYIVYIVWGEGGWFSEVESKTSNDLFIPLKSSKEDYLKQLEALAPKASRIPIGER